MNRSKIIDVIIMTIMAVSAIGMVAVNALFLITNNSVFITDAIYRIPAMGSIVGLTAFCIKDFFFDK